MPDPHFEVAVGIGNTAASVASSALNFAHSQVSSRKMLTIGSEEMKKGLAYVTEQRPTTELGPYVIDLPQRRRLGREFMELSQQREEILASTDSIASNVLFAQRDARYFKRRARRFHDIAKKSSEEARAQAAMKGSVSECSGSEDSGPPPEPSGHRGNTNPLPSAARIDGAQQPSVPAARSYHDASRVRPTEPPHPEPTDSLARAFQSQASVSGNPSQIPNTQALQESRYMYPTMPSSSAYYAPTSNAQYPGSSRQPNRAQYDGSAPRQQMYMASPTQGRVGPSAPETYVPPFPGNNRQPAAGGYTTGYTGRDTSGIGAQSVHVEPYQIQESGRRHGRTSHGTSYTTIPLPGRREASLVRPGPVQPQAARAADNFTTANVGRNDAEYGRSVTQPYYAQAGPAREYYQDVSRRERPRDTEERQDRHRVRQRDASREPRRREDAPSGHRERPRDTEERQNRHHTRQRDTSREHRRREDAPSGHQEHRRTHDRHHSSSHQARRDY